MVLLVLKHYLISISFVVLLELLFITNRCLLLLLTEYFKLPAKFYIIIYLFVVIVVSYFQWLIGCYKLCFTSPTTTTTTTATTTSTSATFSCLYCFCYLLISVNCAVLTRKQSRKRCAIRSSGY